MSGSAPARTAVILAAGRGRRLQATADTGALSQAQRVAADRGDKVMMPVGRPFLDYVLYHLAEAGMERVVLVVRPDADHVAHRYTVEQPPTRLAVRVATQATPRGTAHALLCAEAAVGAEPFLMVNGDNLYPVAALAALAALPGPGLLGFRPAALVTQGNMPAERIARFALIAVGPAGELARIVEKPDPSQVAALGSEALVSMNAWRFEPDVFAACRAVAPSPRGELELQDAVTGLIAAGRSFRVVPWTGPVLDLTSGDDVPALTERLRGVEVRL